MSSKRFVLLLFLAVVGAQVTSAERRLLSESDLLSKSYEEVHKIAILDQVNNHKPAQKSLATRWTKSLNGAFDFCFDESGTGFKLDFQENNLRKVCPQDSFRRMPVPSSFNDITSDNSDRNFMGWFWYQTNFDLPAATMLQGGFDAEQLVEWHIQFESVNYLAVVWIKPIGLSSQRAQLLGSHVGGHLPFIFNLTQFLQSASSDHSNSHLGYTLTVAVNNMLNRDTIPSGRMDDLSSVVGRPFKKFVPDFDFFHFSGILGDINLIALPKAAHFKQIIYLGESVDNTAVQMRRRLRFRVCVHRTRSSDARILLGGFVLDRPRTSGFKFAPLKESKTCTEMSLNLEENNNDNNVWLPVGRNSNGKPSNHFSALVRLKFVLRVDGGEVIDKYELRIGLKDPQSGSLASNRLPLRGFGMHQEELYSGRTMGLAAIMKDMYLLKKTNANLIRTSHYPYSRTYLDQCDEHGIHVIAECPAVGLNSFSEIKLTLHKQILLEMLERDHEHASIIMWSIANEPQSQLVASKGYFEELSDYVRNELGHYLGGRPITAAIAQSYKDDKIAHTLDVIMVNNYFGWYDYLGVLEAIRRPLLASLSGWAEKYPKKMLVLSEHGAESVIGMHRAIDGEPFSEEYQRNLLLEYERVISRDILGCGLGTGNEQLPNSTTRSVASNTTSVINLGASMVWNFADFSTHHSLSRVGGNRKGVYSRTREPKMAAHAIGLAYGSECFV